MTHENSAKPPRNELNKQSRKLISPPLVGAHFPVVMHRAGRRVKRVGRKSAGKADITASSFTHLLVRTPPYIYVKFSLPLSSTSATTSHVPSSPRPSVQMSPAWLSLPLSLSLSHSSAWSLAGRSLELLSTRGFSYFTPQSCCRVHAAEFRAFNCARAREEERMTRGKKGGEIRRVCRRARGAGLRGMFRACLEGFARGGARGILGRG